MNELELLANDILITLEKDDREYEFRKNRGYVERNVSASKFKKNIVGLNASNFGEIISKKL